MPRRRVSPILLVGLVALAAARKGRDATTLFNGRVARDSFARVADPALVGAGAAALVSHALGIADVHVTLAPQEANLFLPRQIGALLSVILVERFTARTREGRFALAIAIEPIVDIITIAVM